MACKLQPTVETFGVQLFGNTTVASTSIDPKISILADIENLTILLKDGELSDYIRAICILTIDDTENYTMRGVKIENTDIYSGRIEFDVDLSDMSFNWWDSFTDIWFETYIFVDTKQMSEDYNITISDDYLDMKGEVLTTYIIKDGVVNYDLPVVDNRLSSYDKPLEVGGCVVESETSAIDKNKNMTIDTGYKIDENDVISPDDNKKPSIVEKQMIKVGTQIKTYF